MPRDYIQSADPHESVRRILTTPSFHSQLCARMEAARSNAFMYSVILYLLDMMTQDSTTDYRRRATLRMHFIVAQLHDRQPRF